jgi:DNA invertase Pin-like site-specific DNA recombinase
MTTPTRVVLLARHSPRPSGNGDDLDSVDKQLAALRAYCERMSWPIDERFVFEERDVSGGDYDRPVFWEAVKATKAGAVLLCRDFQRMARNTETAAIACAKIMAQGGRIQSLEQGSVSSDDPVSQLLFSILAALAQFERHTIAKRSRDASHRKLAGGKYRGLHVPYGWRWLDQEAGTVEEVPEHQAIIQRIRELDEQGRGWKAIATGLSAEGLTFRDGSPWTYMRVRNVVARWKPKRPRRRARGA